VNTPTTTHRYTVGCGVNVNTNDSPLCARVRHTPTRHIARSHRHAPAVVVDLSQIPRGDQERAHDNARCRLHEQHRRRLVVGAAVVEVGQRAAIAARREQTKRLVDAKLRAQRRPSHMHTQNTHRAASHIARQPGPNDLEHLLTDDVRRLAYLRPRESVRTHHITPHHARITSAYPMLDTVVCSLAVLFDARVTALVGTIVFTFDVSSVRSASITCRTQRGAW
jgi:hypothetical protein